MAFFVSSDAREVSSLLGEPLSKSDGYDKLEFHIRRLDEVLGRLALLNHKCVGLKREDAPPRRWIPFSLDPPSDISTFTTDHHDLFAYAIDGLKSGKVDVECVWFLFPRMVGGWLVESVDGKKGLHYLRESRLVLQRKPIGDNLREAANAFLKFKKTSFGKIGAKCATHIKASATLFALTAKDEEDRELYQSILAKFFGGEQDEETILAIERELDAPRNDTPRDLLFTRQKNHQSI